MITTESGPAQSYDFTINGVDNRSWVGGDFIWTGNNQLILYDIQFDRKKTREESKSLV
jgi:hypothetical protein